MKKVLFCLMVVSSLLVMLQVGTMAQATEYVGYLSDVKCATAPNGIAADGTNLQTHPEKHTVACMKMPMCMASGYGVLVKDQKTGKYMFHKFDKKGNEIAKKLLETTKRTDNMHIMIKGMMSEGTIRVESIVEK